MPNGGSDCCGTCWFNTVNNGKPGYPENSQTNDLICEIRNFKPDDPFWTYCANHPHHNPEKIRVPIGPVFVCDDNSYGRIEKISALDTEQVRNELVKLAEQIPEIPKEEYPSATSFSVEIIKHIMFINEVRAIPSLKRILSFNPFSEPADNRFEQNNIFLISNAIECLAKLSPKNSVELIEPWITYGLEKFDLEKYKSNEDQAAPIRYHAVRALKYVEASDVDELLDKACSDPHKEIQAFAREISKLRVSNK